MRIKYTLFTFLLAGLSNVAVAAALNPCPNEFSNIAKPQPKCAEAPDRPLVYNRSYPYYMYQYPYFYFDAGIGAYYLKNPTVSFGNFSGTTTPIASIDNSGFTPIYNFNLGYAFYNPHSSIFGHFNDVVLKFSYLDKTSNKQNNNLTGTLGDVWYIDGSGAALTTISLFNSSLSAKHRLVDTGLYYQSISFVADISRFSMHPRFGLVWTNLYAKYNYILNLSLGAINSADTENYKITTNYYGVAAGDQLAFHIVPQLLLYGDAELQLLHVVSNLDANQEADRTDPFSVRSVSLTQTKNLTYRVIASLGAKYIFVRKADSVSLDVKIGLDRFGYNPHVITPSRANNGSRLHLEGASQNNFFVMLDLSIPIG